MKKAYSAFLFLFLFSFVSYSQTGTIKIAKPPAAKKDTVIPPKKSPSIITITAGGNYTFKGINKIGYDAEVLFIHSFYLGVKYSHEMEYYQLSPYNTETLLPETAYSKSENQFDYIKLPFGTATHMTYGNMKKKLGMSYFSLGLVPEYLLKVKNQYNRLNINNFNRFNLAGNITIGFPFLKHYSVNFSYSKDFFNNLKDKNIYDETGAVVGKQKSKTNLISLSISYRIYNL